MPKLKGNNEDVGSDIINSSFCLKIRVGDEGFLWKTLPHKPCSCKMQCMILKIILFVIELWLKLRINARWIFGLEAF
jgi:hypothetical protein